jgi:glycosyltransferase involved in cell wall biosynthesis
MRVLYVCKAVDEESPTVANQVRWIRSLASKPGVERVTVLTGRRGRADLPGNVDVTEFGRDGWPRTAAAFVTRVARAGLADVDLFFVAQGGPYPALLLPFKLATRTPVYQWKAHPHVSARMRFYARWCDDLVFTATPSSFPASAGRVVVVGHGIDVDLFAFGLRPPDRDLLALGRIAPIKRLDLVLRALAACGEQTGRAPTFDVVGPCAPKDEPYLDSLRDLVARLGLGEQVRFLGSIAHDGVPALLGGYRAAVNMSETAFDKAAGEAMAVGLPVVTSNPCAIEMLPEGLSGRLGVPATDTAAIAATVADVTSWDDATREEVGRRLRDNIVAHHSLDSLFDKILAAVARHRAGEPAGA